MILQRHIINIIENKDASAKKANPVPILNFSRSSLTIWTIIIGLVDTNSTTITHLGTGFFFWILFLARERGFFLIIWYAWLNLKTIYIEDQIAKNNTARCTHVKVGYPLFNISSFDKLIAELTPCIKSRLSWFHRAAPSATLDKNVP